MKQLILSLVIFISSIGFVAAQKNWAAYSLYAFTLPYNLGNHTKATVYYKGKPIASKIMSDGKSKIKIEKLFAYSIVSTNKVSNIQLPISLPENTFAWLCTNDMVIEMATEPTHFKIKITSVDDSVTQQYRLPETFDFIAGNAINLAYAKSLSTEELKNVFIEKIFTLSISPKKIKTPNTTTKSKSNTVINDTILYYSLNGKNKIPPALLQKPYSAYYDSTAKAKQQFIIEKGYLYNGAIFIPINADNKKLQTPIPDGMTYSMMNLQGQKCAPSGGITGRGSGACSGMFSPNTYRKELKITIVINP